MIRTLTVFAIACCLFGCESTPVADDAAPVVRNDASVVAGWLSGSFSSRAQAESDDRFRDVTLEVAPIWPARDDGPWLYVEQALAEQPDRPYRQRIYRLSAPTPGVVISDIFSIPEPRAAVGAWQNPARLNALTPDDLTPLAGCSVRLERAGQGEYAGSTGSQTCPSTVQGASYATSEVRLTPDRLESWDRGFDARGRQVWGSEAGPYIFLRK